MPYQRGGISQCVTSPIMLTTRPIYPPIMANRSAAWLRTSREIRSDGIEDAPVDDDHNNQPGRVIAERVRFSYARFGQDQICDQGKDHGNQNPRRMAPMFLNFYFSYGALFNFAVERARIFFFSFAFSSCTSASILSSLFSQNIRYCSTQADTSFSFWNFCLAEPFCRTFLITTKPHSPVFSNMQ